MKLLDVAKEIARLAGYSITGTDTQSVADKARALTRINAIRADVVSRFSGRWASQYREGWLSIVPVYGAGTVAISQASRTVTGTATAFTAAMVGRKFLGPDSAYYKIAAVSSATVLTLTEPYQGATVTASAAYQIWKDEYVLYPDVFSLIDFVNYSDPMQMSEETNKHGRQLYPRPTYSINPSCFSQVGRKRNVASYSTGTVSITINTRTLTGVGTTFTDNVQPGYEITVGSYTYHVDTVDSDTQLTLIEDAVVTASAASYSARGRNALVVRFLFPSGQAIVNYGYYSKIYPLVNDNDEDWLLELYPQLVINGVLRWDYLDKNDPVRANEAVQLYENDLKNTHMADAGAFGGSSTVGLNIPDSARE